MSDEELLRRMQRGDESAVAEVIDRYGAYVAAVVHNSLGSLSRPEDVEELSSDVFLSLWRGCGSLRKERLKPWLAAVARNRARSHLRELGQPETAEKQWDFAALPDTAEVAEERERRRQLAEALSCLGEPDREIFLRRFYYGQSVPEIAAATGLHPENVKTRLRRGRGRLKKLLEKGGCEL